VRFSRDVGANRPQDGSPVVSLDRNADVALSIDAYAVTKGASDLVAHCHTAIFS